jgi:cytochrome c556
MTRTLAIYALLLLASCSAKTPAPAPERLASVQEIMASMVDPSADSLWDSVGSTLTPKGYVDRQPKTDQEWQQVRHWAVTLAEAPNLLVMPGRRVAVAGGKLDDADVKGIEPPAAIQAAIDKDPAAFALKAKGLQDAARQAIAAVDARNPQGLLDAGGRLDTACEACHLQYWYPNAPRPPEHQG